MDARQQPQTLGDRFTLTFEREVVCSETNTSCPHRQPVTTPLRGLRCCSAAIQGPPLFNSPFHHELRSMFSAEDIRKPEYTLFEHFYISVAPTHARPSTVRIRTGNMRLSGSPVPAAGFLQCFGLPPEGLDGQKLTRPMALVAYNYWFTESLNATLACAVSDQSVESFTDNLEDRVDLSRIRHKLKTLSEEHRVCLTSQPEEEDFNDEIDTDT